MRPLGWRQWFGAALCTATALVRPACGQQGGLAAISAPATTSLYNAGPTYGPLTPQNGVGLAVGSQPADPGQAVGPAGPLILPPPPPAERWTQGLYGLAPNCDECPNHGVLAFVGYDSWRGVSDDSWQNNGIHSGLNYGTRLGRLSELTGVGFQAGGSMGVYDWAGSDYRARENSSAQPQAFLTYGLFRKSTDRSRWNAAVVQDWMLNSNYGVFAQNPTLSQVRVQVGFATSALNEFGVWSAWHVMSDTRFVAGVGSTTWRPINQLNPYWHYKWGQGGADTWLWVGVPERHRLAGSGSLGDYIAGAAANAPLNDRVALYTLVTYMHQSAAPGIVGSEEDAWNFTVGLSFYPGRNARWRTVAGQCWMPALPVANNGTFMVDTNHH